MVKALTERRAIELSWQEVCEIAAEAIKEILGIQISCRADVTGTEYWALVFENPLSLPKLCQLLQAIQATPGDWEAAMPADGEADVDAIGMVQAEKLISRRLKLQWKYHLITEDSLWLVGVADNPVPNIQK